MSDDLVGALDDLEKAEAEIDRLCAELAAKDARIEALQGGAERYWEDRWRDDYARAERAEAVIERLNNVRPSIHQMGDVAMTKLQTPEAQIDWYRGWHQAIERAERAEAEAKVMREALETIKRNTETPPPTLDQATWVLNVINTYARAALNPFSAGEKT